jgi:hypothetical protein
VISSGDSKIHDKKKTEANGALFIIWPDSSLSKTWPPNYPEVKAKAIKSATFLAAAWLISYISFGFIGKDSTKNSEKYLIQGEYE